MSQLVMNIPPDSVTWKDCANGSYQKSLLPVSAWALLIASVFITLEPVNVLVFLSSLVGLVWITAFRVEIIFSWTVSIVPAAV